MWNSNSKLNQCRPNCTVKTFIWWNYHQNPIKYHKMVCVYCLNLLNVFSSFLNKIKTQQTLIFILLSHIFGGQKLTFVLNLWLPDRAKKAGFFKKSRECEFSWPNPRGSGATFTKVRCPMSLKAICLKKIELRQVSSIYRNQDLGCPDHPLEA